jgi:hypothetical protein
MKAGKLVFSLATALFAVIVLAVLLLGAAGS